jgi:hypothetical protein
MMTVDTAPDQREALDRLSRVYGEGSLRTTVLALVMDRSAEAAQSAWQHETADVGHAASLRADAECLDEPLRLPVLDVLLDRVRQLPKPDRRTLLQAFRRVMAARGSVRPIDRLQWLQMRRKLGDRLPAATLPASPHDSDTARLTESMRYHVAATTAYLSRIVPDGDPDTGRRWYAAVLQRFMPLEAGRPCEPPDGDGLVHALEEVETLPWMLRPVLMRAWLDTALAVTARTRLAQPAADALRLVASLLDSPLPPELARHYGRLDWATARESTF